MIAKISQGSPVGNSPQTEAVTRVTGRLEPDSSLKLVQEPKPGGGVWPEWLSVKDLAMYLSVGVSTIWHWYNVRKLPAPKLLNGRKRWRRSDIDRNALHPERFRRNNSPAAQRRRKEQGRD